MEQSRGIIQFLLISCITLYLVEKVNCDAYVNIGRSTIVGQTVYSSGSIAKQFLAIPYAEPPTGNLRFKKPIPRKFLPDIYAALNYPPACWQRSVYPFPWYDTGKVKDEDCLYLNIWTPEDASPGNNKAVLYFIHDGGFRYGSNRQKLYYGAPLASHGDVIVVTVNYRVGSFGFLTSGTEDAPGNIGLYDILEGLKWVNKHIAAFGGDTDQITVAGLGSGAVAAGVLATSPLAKGLFDRMIMESGSPAYPDMGSMKLNLDLSQKVAERVFCANKTQTIRNSPTEVLKCLRNVLPETLTAVTATMKPLSSMLFVPQFGDELVPVDPAKAIQNKNFTCNKLLIGNTHDEGSFQLTTHHPVVYGFYGSLDPTINKTLGIKEMKRGLSSFPNKKALVNHYLPDSLSDDAHDTIRKQVYTSFGDATLVCPTTFYAEQCAAGGGNAYYYVWNHRPSNSVWFPWMGVAHATEIEFVFGQPLLHGFYYLPDETELSKNIIDLWSSFARDGKPNISWPKFSKENPQVKVLGPGANDHKDQKSFHKESCDFFRPYYGF